MLKQSLEIGELEVPVPDRPAEIEPRGGNPFPGLRPFTIDECHLFFGREGQADEILVKLSENRFVTVMGYSGSGKSSLTARLSRLASASCALFSASSVFSCAIAVCSSAIARCSRAALASESARIF